MKKLFLCALVVSLVACNSDKKEAPAGPKNTDLIQQNLKGKVQTMEERVVIIDSTGKAKGNSSVNSYAYDEKGYITAYSTKDSAGRISFDQTMKRNADGTFSELTNTKYGKMTYRLTTEEKDGKYSAAKSYDSTGKQASYYTDLKTNDYGIVYSGKEHFMNDKIKSTFDMKYDGPDFVGGSSTDSTGATDYTGTVKLNDKRDPMEETSTTKDKSGTKTEVSTYKYVLDDKGNWIQRTTTNDKGKVTKTVNRVISYYKD